MTLNGEVQPGDWVVVDASQQGHSAELTGQVWSSALDTLYVGGRAIRFSDGSTSLLPRVLRRCDPLPEPRPEGWPPTEGQVWADEKDRAWVAAVSPGGQVELLSPHLDWWTADAAWWQHGPLRLVLTPKATP